VVAVVPVVPVVAVVPNFSENTTQNYLLFQSLLWLL
jgi:hypothetical protein